MWSGYCGEPYFFYFILFDKYSIIHLYLNHLIFYLLYRCEASEVDISGSKNYDAHIKGRKHENKLKLVIEAGDQTALKVLVEEGEFKAWAAQRDAEIGFVLGWPNMKEADILIDKLFLDS